MSEVHATFAAHYRYRVWFGSHFLDPRNDTLLRALSSDQPRRVQRVLFAVDQGLAEAQPGLEAAMLAYAGTYPERLRAVGAPLRIPGGERCKNDTRVLATVYGALDRFRLDRHSFVVVAGGGAVLDLVGYAAATAHRGIRLVRLPSTVLAQADSGVGVKNGVNALGKKNFLGTFAPPFAVLNDASLLRTLGLRDVRAGLAEAVKVALLRDPVFFRWIFLHADALAGGEAPAVGTLVRRCAQLHLRHITTSGDPFETGSSRPLDFGHWAAHKLETLTKHALRHGEAVAIGIALDTLYSARVGLCDPAVAAQVLDVLTHLGLPTFHEALLEPHLFDGLEEFREHLGGELAVPLLRDIGDPVDADRMDPAAVRACIERLAARRAA